MKISIVVGFNAFIEKNLNEDIIEAVEHKFNIEFSL